MKREAIGPTAVGQGVAVPHTRLAGLESMVGALGVSPAGIPFDESSGGRVHAMFMFLAPVWDHEGYLNLLAMVSRIVRDGTFVQQARGAETAARLTTLLREFEGRIAP
jgi:PTS system nitrogen regulatory IIA component